MTDKLHILTTKLHSLRAQFPYLLRVLALLWKAARGWSIAWALLLLLQGLLPAATVYLTRRLVDSLVFALGPHRTAQSLRFTLLLIAVLAAIMLLTELLRSSTVWVRTAMSELMQDRITTLIHRQSVALDLAFYDSPDYYDHLHRARAEATYRPVALVESLGNLIQNGITLSAMLTVLLPFGLWLPLALILSTLPAFYVVLRYSIEQHQWRIRSTADERRVRYYDWLLTTGEAAAELRLFALGEHFQSLYRGLRERLRGERLRLAKRQSVAELAAGSAALSITGGVLAWMTAKAIHGLITLGDLALFYQAFQLGLRLMRSLLENVGQLYSNSLFLSHLFEFLELQPQVVDPPAPQPAPAPVQGKICFHQVTFHYPGTTRLALRDFNLTIPAGQMVAIVGSNGAGKSTLSKLLCRFYDPDAGRVELDGIDLRDLSLSTLRGLITALFQNPVHYNASVAQNIAWGDLASSPGAAGIATAAAAAGAQECIARLPYGYESLLGRWFAGGSELSVGEWQRIALARAFLRRSPILVLDEPTSAMDPWAEAEWLDKVPQLARGRTVILITHRFTTAMRADMIHVIEDGRIAESGCHQELLARGGRYAQSWTTQMQG